jgi:hypothetical protein
MKFVGADAAGIPRVYGEASNPHLAYIQCVDAIKEYVKRRPDTGPTSAWLIESAVKDEAV